MPHWSEQLAQNRIVVTPLDRGLNGPDGATGQFTGAAEANFFEVLADLRRHFRTDADRILLSGYSLGAYADYHLAELWPDLFAALFSVVGTAPTNGRDTELLANLRHVPVLAWNQADDALVPYTDVSATAARLDELGLRHEQWTFPAGNHLAPALRDDWAPAAKALGDPTVTRNPTRIDFGYYPSLDDRRLGLVHDHAYWVSELRLARPAGQTARGDVTAISKGPGRGDPPAERYSATGSAGGSPATITGTRWGATPRRARRNELDLTLTNLRRLRVDARAARLTDSRSLTIRATSSTRATLVLTFGRRRVTVRLGSGRTTHKLPAR
jgi:dienelactone hydrolase